MIKIIPKDSQTNIAAHSPSVSWLIVASLQLAPMILSRVKTHIQNHPIWRFHLKYTEKIKGSEKVTICAAAIPSRYVKIPSAAILSAKKGNGSCYEEKIR